MTALTQPAHPVRAAQPTALFQAAAWPVLTREHATSSSPQ